MKNKKHSFEAATRYSMILAVVVLLLSPGGFTSALSAEVSGITGGNTKQAAPDLNVKQKERGPEAGSAALTGIPVSFKLDGWLISGNYGSEFWVSSPVLGPASQPGNTFTVEARATGVDAQGHGVDISPEWIPEDPDMVAVSPIQGKQVKITVKHAGKSTLKVVTHEFSKVLSIKAMKDGDKPIQVEISQ